MKKHTIILIVACFLGLCVLAYPTFSDYWNRTRATHAINSFMEQISNVDEVDCEAYMKEAVAYNEELKNNSADFDLTAGMREKYNKCLNVSGTGIMGYIEIPKIDVTLPVYHGTSNEVLNSAIGHIEWSSLPVGGAGTHCVLSGHRGLASAKIFTDLDKLREGDIFELHVLNETMTYEVDRMRTVLPDEISTLGVSGDNDFCSLVTCTPYGINTHRLIVRGHRVTNVSAEANIIAEAVRVDQLIVAVFLAMPLLFVLFLMVMFQKPKKKIVLPDSDKA